MTLTSMPKVSRGALPVGQPPVIPMPPDRMYERALTLIAMGFHDDAGNLLREITSEAPDHSQAWQKLAELLRLAGKDSEADAADSHGAGPGAIWPAFSDPRTAAEINSAERALREQIAKMTDLRAQLKALRDRLRDHETDVTAMRVLANLESRRGDLMRARALLERALDLAPHYEGARADLAELLQALGEDRRAVVETGRLIEYAPTNVAFRAMHADALRAIGEHNAAIPILEQLVRDQPAQTRYRCVYAQTLRVIGRQEESAREFRACIELQPGMGEAYWGLAELRGNFLTRNDTAAMQAYLRDSNQDDSNRMLLYNALGQALEREGDFAASFAAYEAGARLSQAIAQLRGAPYNSAWEADQLRRWRAAFNESLFARELPAAKPDTTPIFVLGMPRAGSTLVEQILASHSLVEGTMELPVLGNIVRDLSYRRPDDYPECVRGLTASDLTELGARYLREAGDYRKTKAPYFIDKRPWNWPNAGLIRLILPHAKIVDVRREPMAACFAMFKHMLANDDAVFPHDFDDLAHYYTQYAGMMAHYGTVMPGHIHFLSYERLVEDTETEIRRLLAHCGLPFEEGCLRFWETDRAVATPSSEQVRRPIYRDALQQWRNFEPWLRPLRDALKAAEEESAATPQPLDYERALTLAAMGMHEAAIGELRAIATRVPNHPGAWMKLAELLRKGGKVKAADQADASADRCAAEAPKWRPTHDARTPAQMEAAERKLQAELSPMSRDGRIDALRKQLLENPVDAAAAHMLSTLHKQMGNDVTSLALLERTLELAPYHHPVRAELALQFIEYSFFTRALEQTTILMRQARRVPEYRAIHCDALKGVGDYTAAMEVAEELVREYPREPRFWFGYGDLLHYVGRRDDSARAFRTCLELMPKMGRAYWRLADLKSGYLTEGDVVAMRGILSEPSLEPSSRMYMYYALGHALEKMGDFSSSFAAYQKGARLFRGSFLGRGESYDEEKFVESVKARKRVFTARNLAKRAVTPAASPTVTPIFIVGMPRAGSTLVEQILASHSQVEGTRELPLISDIIHELALGRILLTPNAYPDCVLEMPREELAALGERYLLASRIYRKTERPYFIDKRPWNWLEAGLIHTILPHARIIDVRREPMAACFAMFKQVLPDSDFSYDLRDLGRYYVEYAGLMEHWRSAMPGRIHSVQYERLVENTESEIRQLLAYCGLPFEESCLRFWETDRAVYTPSAEQVRRPIFRDALQQWQNFEPWLGPLKTALSKPPRA